MSSTHTCIRLLLYIFSSFCKIYLYVKKNDKFIFDSIIGWSKEMESASNTKSVFHRHSYFGPQHQHIHNMDFLRFILPLSLCYLRIIFVYIRRTHYFVLIFNFYLSKKIVFFQCGISPINIKRLKGRENNNLTSRIFEQKERPKRVNNRKSNSIKANYFVNHYNFSILHTVPLNKIPYT